LINSGAQVEIGALVAFVEKNKQLRRILRGTEKHMLWVSST